MDCCGNETVLEQGVVRERKCRDVLCLLLFLAFWAGMVVICVFAFRQGDYNRLIYGVDSYGFTCGSVNTWNGIIIDNTKRPNLYALNALSLLSPSQLPFAKTICVADCPGPSSVCGAPNQMPCTRPDQMKCPYYGLVDNILRGKLSGVADASTDWYPALVTMSPTFDPAAQATIIRLQAMSQLWIQQWTMWNAVNPNQNVSGSYYQLTSQFPAAGPCSPIYAPTVSYLGRCFPSFPSGYTAQVSPAGPPGSSSSDAVGTQPDTTAYRRQFTAPAAKWARYVGDLSQALLMVVVAGVVGGVVLSLFWLVLAHLTPGFMAWITLLTVLLGSVGVTLFSFSNAGMLDFPGVGQDVSSSLPVDMDPTETERVTWKWIGVAAAIGTGVICLITIICFSRIWVALACLKIANKALSALPAVFLLPVISVVLEVALVIYWVSVTAMLYTAGDLTATCRLTSAPPFTFSSLTAFYGSSAWSTDSASYTCYEDQDSDARIQLCANNPNCYMSYRWNAKFRWLLIYHFFGLLWTHQVLAGLTCVAVAGAVASHYWADTHAMPTLSALTRCLIYHMGCVCYGGFLMAIFQPIRYIFELLDRQIKAVQARDSLCQAAMCCVHCCGWCLTSTLCFVNRTAYVVVGSKGSNYCQSSARASHLLVQNALRIVTFSTIGDTLLFLAKASIGAVCGCIAFAIATLPVYQDPAANPATFVPSPILPVALSIVVGYFIAELFFCTFEVAVDAIVLSYCEDCVVNEGRPKHAPDALVRALGASNSVQPLPR